MKTIKAIHFILSLLPLIWITTIFLAILLMKYEIYVSETEGAFDAFAWWDSPIYFWARVQVWIDFFTRIIALFLVLMGAPFWITGAILMLRKKQYRKAVLRNAIILLTGIIIITILWDMNPYNWVGSYID